MIDQSPIAALAGDPATAYGFIGKSARLTLFCLAVQITQLFDKQNNVIAKVCS
jgi:hypothetical protein